MDALPGARRLVKHLAAHAIPLGLATSTSRSSCDAKFGSHGDIQNCFNVTVCGDEVIKGKPEPDMFLKVAQLLNVSPGECLVIEDAVAGIQVQHCQSLQHTATGRVGCDTACACLQWGTLERPCPCEGERDALCP